MVVIATYVNICQVMWLVKIHSQLRGTWLWVVFVVKKYKFTVFEWGGGLWMVGGGCLLGPEVAVFPTVRLE